MIFSLTEIFKDRTNTIAFAQTTFGNELEQYATMLVQNKKLAKIIASLSLLEYFAKQKPCNDLLELRAFLFAMIKTKCSVLNAQPCNHEAEICLLHLLPKLPAGIDGV